MKKLQSKVFWTISIMLTCFLISIFILFHVQNYNHEKTNIEMNLKRIHTNWDREIKKDPASNEESIDNSSFPKREKDDFSKKIFMDSIVYTILLDQNNQIIEVISHNEESEEQDNIIEVATKILTNKKIEETYIGNLYFAKYSYTYQSYGYLTIMDNEATQQKLLSSLKFSTLLLIGLEFIIILVSKIITNWIIKPVEISFEKKKQFIADASHELKTPLAVIMASSDALERDCENEKWLQNIKNETSRMNQLITDLLDLTKLETVNNHKNTYDLKDLSKIIEMQILTFESIAFEEGILLEYDIEENLMFHCEENQMKQLISILLDNAIKHSEKKKPISIKLKKERGEIVLTVTNKGEAISKEDQEKIFERFYRVDKSRNRKENRYGLGLAIAKNIVLNHQRKISASSSNGYTTFRVVLK